jgi:hypothetical protein
MPIFHSYLSYLGKGDLDVAASTGARNGAGGEPAIRLHVHATRSTAAAGPAGIPVRAGRPDLAGIVAAMEADASLPGRGVAVVGCGPGPLMEDLEVKAQVPHC